MRNVGTASLKWVKFAFKESQSEWYIYWATGSPRAQIQGDFRQKKSVYGFHLGQENNLLGPENFVRRKWLKAA